MEQTGWASTTPYSCIFFCGGPYNYPRIRRSVSFDLEVGYRKAPRHGYFIGFGVPEVAEITGRTPGGTYLYLKSRLLYGSVRWAWYSRNSRFINSIGPALLVSRDAESVGPGIGSSHTQVCPGVQLSSQFRFIDRRTWLLAFKAYFRTGLSATTQTYEKQELTFSPTGSTTRSVQLPGRKLPLTHANIGLQIGLKYR
ncbi:hypothetical protein GCM10023189_37190 [Nibrella saemangeumensis]|uniref:Outer membrane protein beta-barrel domain-containing protein n=2 Tax=Nibrella saemangeumensis TaxID=1084526 RepID=A0ABP8N878_9BACT